MGAHRTRPGTVRLAVVIPWRSSGDPDREANAAHVVDHYQRLDLGPVIVTDDGRSSGHFNRSAAYNRGLAQTDADVILWVEADTLLPADQITTAAHLAHDAPGIVIPYTERHELDPTQTARVHAGTVDPFTLHGAAAIYPGGSSIGQAGVTSRHTLDLIGGRWDDGYEGWGYDDNGMLHIFETLAGRTRWVEGKGIHLWHQPGYVSPSPEQAAATARNAARFHYMRTLCGEELRAWLLRASPTH